MSTPRMVPGGIVHRKTIVVRLSEGDSRSLRPNLAVASLRWVRSTPRALVGAETATNTKSGSAAPSLPTSFACRPWARRASTRSWRTSRKVTS